MRVIGLLSFFDEEPGHLTESILSFAEAGVDHLIAVDGAYALFPVGTPASPLEQQDAVRAAAREAGIGLTTFTPTTVWQGNEVEKRTHLFALGHAQAKPREDWLFVFDADEIVTEHGDIKAALERTGCDVGAVLHGEPGVRPRSERRLFRAHPKGITVQGAHFHYVNGSGDTLWGPTQVDRDMLPVQILHRPLQRSKARNARRCGYYENRLMNNAEVMVW